MTFSTSLRRWRLPCLLGGAALAASLLAGCNASPSEPSPAPEKGAARFKTLLANPKWYRTFDSTSTILPADGELLFAWTFGDSTQHPDSFYVGMDTLWALPQNMLGDTANDWDLQLCPDGFCAGGIRNHFFGQNAATHFGATSEGGVPEYGTEHHVEFFPATDSSAHYAYTGPDSALFGALLFVRSRSTGKADTVLAYGAWKLPWDSAYAPPVRPGDVLTKGRLPKRADFRIVNGKVRYQPVLPD